MSKPTKPPARRVAVAAAPPRSAKKVGPADGTELLGDLRELVHAARERIAAAANAAYTQLCQPNAAAAATCLADAEGERQAAAFATRATRATSTPSTSARARRSGTG